MSRFARSVLIFVLPRLLASVFIIGGSGGALAAEAAEDEETVGDATSEIDGSEAIVQLTGGYVLRIADDGRTHGGGLTLLSDIGLGSGIGLRIETGFFGFGGSATAPSPLLLQYSTTSVSATFFDGWFAVFSGLYTGLALTMGPEPIGFSLGLVSGLDLRIPLMDHLWWVLSYRFPLTLIDLWSEAPAFGFMPLVVTSGLALSF